MTRRSSAVLLLAIGAVVAAHAAAQTVTFQVVVHADNPVAVLSTKQLGRLFLGKTGQWDDGVPVEPVDHEDREVRDAFSTSVHGKPTSAVEKYWQRMNFSGRGVAPPGLATDQAVLDFVSRHRGAVGYVSAAVPLIDGVRVVHLTDLGSSPSFAGQSTTVLAQRGDVRLLLTGGCGTGGEGRLVVVQNRHPYAAVKVTTETARWTKGRFNARHLSFHTLAGHEEKELGCTSAGASVELRFALVEVSGDVAGGEPWRAAGRPPRDFISVVDSGTCGQGGQGRRMAVVNEHPVREIAVRIEHVVKIGDRVTHRSMQSLRLEPGAQKHLGCSHDGSVVHEYHLRQVD